MGFRFLGVCPPNPLPTAGRPEGESKNIAQNYSVLDFDFLGWTPDPPEASSGQALKGNINIVQNYSVCDFDFLGSVPLTPFLRQAARGGSENIAQNYSVWDFDFDFSFDLDFLFIPGSRACLRAFGRQAEPRDAIKRLCYYPLKGKIKILHKIIRCWISVSISVSIWISFSFPVPEPAYVPLAGRRSRGTVSSVYATTP